MEKLKKWKKEYENVEPPQDLLEQVNMTMDKAMREKKKNKIYYQKWLSWAAVLILLVGIPNLNADAAKIMAEIPLIGGVFRVVTIRNYHYDDGHSMADVAVPVVMEEVIERADSEMIEKEELMAEQVKTSGSSEHMIQENSVSGTAKINKQTQNYIEQLLEEFEKNKEEIGEGYQGLDIDYEVITNNDTWFTLQIYVVQTMASGAEQIRYYHIDKKTGEMVVLSDLFNEDTDYITVISDEIKRQMIEQMQSDAEVSYFYENEMFAEDNFNEISETQNFYFNEAGELVIAFDEYEIAPGYMGCPEFVIPKSVIKAMEKE